MRRTLAAALLGLALAASAVPGTSTPASDLHVIVLVVDGLEPESLNPVLMPNLMGLLTDGRARTWTNAQATMITETNPNHTAMVTGAEPQISGLVANSFFNVRAAKKEAMERPSLLLSPTLFDAIEAQAPALRTASIMGKEKLRFLFDCTKAGTTCGPSADNPEGVTVNHVRPDFVGGASTRFDPDSHEHDAPAEPGTGSGYTIDDEVTDILIARYRSADAPNFAFVNLAAVDGLQHLFGARSGPARAAVLNADRNIGRLVQALKETERWERTVLVVTADHSFAETGDPRGAMDVAVANPVTPHATGTAIVLPSLLGSCANGTPFTSVANGGAASVYLTNDDPYTRTSLSPAQAACLRELHDRALASPHVTRALYRQPADGTTDLLGATGWNLAATPRVGDLVLIAGDGATFLESRTSSSAVVAGNHGGPVARPVPFLLASGGAFLAAGTDATNAVRPNDIAATVAWILGITPPAHSTGRVLTEAFTAQP